MKRKALKYKLRQKKQKRVRRVKTAKRTLEYDRPYGSYDPEDDMRF